MKKQLNIGLLIVCTGKYDVFLEPLLNSAEKYFLKGHNVTPIIFTDKDSVIGSIGFKIEHHPFPYPTYNRYHFFTDQKEHLLQYDYLFYIDVDMLFVSPVGDEILADLVAVRHPAFHHGGGSWCKNARSTAFTPPSDRTSYLAGGFQGGKTEYYLKACETIRANIDIDKSKGVLAEWHDESHWNKYLSYNKHLELNPQYCMVEELDLRTMWKIINLPPKIIALKKDHKTLRE